MMGVASCKGSRIYDGRLDRFEFQEERSLKVDLKDLSLVELLRLGGVSDKELERMS